MNLHLHSSPTRRRGLEAVALVITLLMLSVITFLAIAFLAMSRSNRAAVSASLDVATARAMSEAAQGRAQTEIMAQMLARGDVLAYDYMVSRNYINVNGFTSGDALKPDPNNVNYDYFYANSGSGFHPPFIPANGAINWSYWVQNIANLYYDPRPPVFVMTNPATPNNLDFRFWVDINRNGRFETNGYWPTNNEFNVFGGSTVLNGEPEFIGVLKNPMYPHSSTNQFIGRYAYLVLPIGKTLDLNYIHNFLKETYGNVGASYPVNQYPLNTQT